MITIDYSDYIHISEISYYNHNFYKPKDVRDSNVYLYEVCHEDYDYFSFYLVDGDKKIHLGDCDCNGNNNNKVTIRKLGEFYT